MKKIMFILGITSLLCACSSDKDTAVELDAKISISATEIQFTPDGVAASAEVTVQSSDDWKLTGDNEWCTPSVYEGASGATVSFTANANTTEEAREVTFVFMTGNKATKLHVKQNSNGVFHVDENVFNVGEGNEGICVRLTTNIDYTIEIPEEFKGWIIDNQAEEATKATQTDWLTFSIKANDSYGKRTGTINITDPTGNTKVVTVNQERNEGFVLPGESVEVSKAGEVYELTIKSNVPYTIEIDDKYSSWLTHIASSDPQPNYEDGLITTTERFNIAPGGAGLRIGKIKVKSNSGDKTLLVRQPTDNPIYAEFTDENLRKAFEDQDLAISVEGNRMELTAGLIELTELNISRKKITSIEGLEALTQLTKLDVSSNKLTTIDLSGFTTLTEVKLSRNAWASINLGDNVITKLEFDSYYGFKEEGSWSGDTSTDVIFSGSQLQEVVLTNNNLNSVDLSACPALTKVVVGSGWYKVSKVILSTVHEGNVTIEGSPQVEYK
jgi:Leucine-rich repeat (LRR) protein